MIPVAIVPYLNRPDLFLRLLPTLPAERLVVIDNSPDGSAPAPDDAVVIRARHNLGVAAAWNLGIKLTPLAPWWFIVNSDIVLLDGAVAALEDAIGHADLVLLDGMAAFALTPAAIERVGWFDENYHPAYVEDCDWLRRARLAALEPVKIGGLVAHEGSAVIRSDRHLADENNRTYMENKRYHREKWGGEPWEEKYEKPFGTGECRHLSLARLRSQTWR